MVGVGRALAAFVVISLVFGLSAGAASGLTLADFKLKRAVAVVGTTVEMSVRGTIDRDLHAGTVGLRKSPAFTVQQTCRSDADPGLVETVSHTNIFPFVSFSSSTTFADRGHGKKVEWTVMLSYDPATDSNVGHPDPPGPNALCPLGYSPTTQLRVTHVLLRIWPGVVGSPPLTDKGELLWIVIEVDAGHTTFGPPRDAGDD